MFDGPSRVVDLGQARRFVGAARRAVEIRDRHCTHPGYDEPAQRCQGDHIQPWSTGGPTTPDNGQLRCGYQNHWRWHHPDTAHPPSHHPRLAAPVTPNTGQDTGLDWLETSRANLRATILAEPDDWTRMTCAPTSEADRWFRAADDQWDWRMTRRLPARGTPFVSQRRS